MTDAPHDQYDRDPAEGGEVPDAGHGAEHTDPEHPTGANRTGDHPTGDGQAAENRELDPPA